MDIRHYVCVLCGGRPTPSNRRPASSFIQILSRNFSVDAVETDVLCNKCRHKCRNISRRKQLPNPRDEDESKDPTFTSPKKRKTVPISSPPSISLPLPSSSKSHAYCFVCKKPGPKLLCVSNQARIHEKI